MQLSNKPSDLLAAALRYRSRNTGSSGLGLPIAHAIAAAHQGTLEVNSTLNKGSLFTLRLPY